MSIRWSWLSFLVSELGLTTAFLVGIIVITKRSQLQVMKSSSLAAMCALDEETRLHLGDINDLTSLEDRASRTEVKLEKSVSGVGVRLSMLTTPCPPPGGR